MRAGPALTAPVDGGHDPKVTIDSTGPRSELPYAVTRFNAT